MMFWPRKLVYYTTLVADMIRHDPIKRPWWTKIDEKVILGAMPFHDRGHMEKLKKLGVTGVITLNRMYELSPNLLGTPVMPHDWIKEGMTVCYKPIDDYSAPSQIDYLDCLDFINRNKMVYVHCKAGKGRSVVVVLKYLMDAKQMTYTEALKFLQAKRPYISPNEIQLSSISTASHS